MFTVPLTAQYAHPRPGRDHNSGVDVQDAQRYTRRLMRLSSRAEPFVTRGQDLTLLSGSVTYDLQLAGQASLHARVSDPETARVHRALTRLNAVHPGLAAWVLQEVDEVFALTHPVTTPLWITRLIGELTQATARQRRDTFRRREAGHPRARERYTEKAIARAGFPTTASALVTYGHWLCTSPFPSGDARAYALLRASSPEHDTLADVLSEARHTPPPDAVCAHRAPFPALILDYAPGSREDDTTDLVQDTLDHLTHVWRSHDGTFGMLDTDSPRAARTYLRVLAHHQSLGFELRALLDG